jgi:hypothetical protein
MSFRYSLNRDDQSDFYSRFGSRINQELPMEITFREVNKPTFEILKQRSGTELTKRSDEIAEFIGSRIGIEYIPAVRTAGEAIEVVQRLLDSEMRDLKRDPEYKRALDTLSELERPRLDGLGQAIRDTLGDFLPDIPRRTCIPQQSGNSG